MSKSGITRVRLEPGQPLPVGKTEWARLDAMTDEEIDAAGRSDPDNLPLTDADFARMEVVPNLRRIRERLGMTQEQFADAYFLPIGTVRDWEQRRRMPDAPARALLRAIAREPDTMRRLVSRAAE